MTQEDTLRILRAATHWAAGRSKEFAAQIAAATAPLAFTLPPGGAVTLTGTTATGGTISLCLAAGEIRLARHELLHEADLIGVRTVEVHLTLPRYLASQIKGAAADQVAA